MRPVPSFVAFAIAAVCGLSLAAPPRAAALPFVGELSISISTLEPIVVRGNGTSVVGTRDGAHLAALGLDAAAFATDRFVVPVSDPGAAPIRGLQATLSNGVASFAETAAGAFGGSMPLRGAVKVCLFGPCSAAIANIEVPLSAIGSGGSNFVSAAVNVTVQGAPWTTRTVTVGTVTARGGALGPAGATSSTAQIDGQLNAVTPVYVSTNIGAFSVVPVFGFLRLVFGTSDFPACDDGVDNDGDGLVDYPEDPGCTSDIDPSENDPARICDDGIDNDGDGATDYPADPGCLSLADPSEAPDLLCDVEMNDTFLRVGETAILSSLRFANLQASPVEARLRLQLRLPPSVLYTIEAVDVGAGGGFSLPGSFDRQLGPATIFSVTPTTPPIRGNFEWRCALEDPATGEVIVEDRAAFFVQ